MSDYFYTGDLVKCIHYVHLTFRGIGVGSVWRITDYNDSIVELTFIKDRSVINYISPETLTLNFIKLKRRKKKWKTT